MSTHIIVVGGGPGGYVAAIRAAQLGGTVTLVERKSIGGTCLNYGCIPTKALCKSAESVLEAKRMHEWGVMVQFDGVDMEKVHAWKDQAVEKITGGVRQLLKGYGVNVVYGTARLAGKPGVEVTEPGGRTEFIEGDAVVLATGSNQAVPDIPGIDSPGVVTSRELLATKELPKRLFIYGGGYIAMEFASIYNALGSEVTVMVRSKVLRKMDGDLGKRIRVALKKRGVEFYEGTVLEGISATGQGLSLSASGKKGEITLEADMVLVATGNTPCVDGLGLEEAGVSVNSKGIETDEHFRTSLPGVYAIGDVKGPPYLAHVASEEGKAVVEHILGHPSAGVDYAAVPAAVFTIPEAASVGLTEEELKESGEDYKVGKFPYAANGKAVTMGEEEGFVKVLLRQDNTIAGVHILGAQASTLIHEAALAIHARLPLSAVLSGVHAHPTLAEAFHEASLAAEGIAIHQMPPRNR
jgi:dihydrolipoamide dehydrogenase